MESAASRQLVLAPSLAAGVWPRALLLLMLDHRALRAGALLLQPLVERGGLLVLLVVGGKDFPVIPQEALLWLEGLQPRLPSLTEVQDEVLWAPIRAQKCRPHSHQLRANMIKRVIYIKNA